MSLLLPRRAFSHPSTSSVTGLLCWLGLTACGAGPTEGPKSADPGIVVGGVPGSTTSRIPQEQSQEIALKPRAKTPPTEDKRPADEPEIAAPADAGPDPMNGLFTLPQAVAGLPEKGALVALIKTNKGDLKCKLFDDKAPVAVANFVGLARGTRPLKEKGKWVTRAAYDGTSFHRIIKGFMVQGGDPQGTGRGEPGYVFKDEIWAGAKHDRAGLLCTANRGHDTNGVQLFITDAAAAHLDGNYTIFGECAPVNTVHAIASVDVDGEKPVTPVTIDRVAVANEAP